MLTDQPVRDLLQAFSSPDPTPGGGSASALASAIGVSLLRMVAGLPGTRSGSEEDRRALQEASATLDGLGRQLTDAIDADAAAYEQVVAAFKRPRGSEPERQARRAAIQEATLGATRVPLSVMHLSAAALGTSKSVALHGNRSAASDVGVAIGLLRAGLQGARLNVEINLKGLNDQPLVGRLRADAARLAEEATHAASEAEECLRTD